MLVSFKKYAACTVITFKENIQVYNAMKIRNEIVQVITENNLTKIIFNFNEIQFVDSSGIGLFINLNATYQDNVKFRFCHLNKDILQVFEFTQINTIFAIDNDLETSVKLIKGQ